ncbi:MAG: glutamate--tRNA ligase [Phycisphaerales bacterium]
MLNPPVVTRFAPSPTGHLHVGGARSALFCWAFAKKHGGHFTLRIEDTDQARSSDESARGIMEDLAWLGIEWDEGPEFTHEGRKIGGDPQGVGPFFQARRVALYNKYLMQLIEQGRAYPAFESSEELDAKRKAAVAAKQTYRYDRASYHAYPTPEARLARMKEADAKGETYPIRFYAPAEEVVVHDEVLGDVKYAAGEMDDFVIRKADGFPTYHFAVVVDDETMGVTHVMRAQEHLNNTPRHVALQKALGFRTPVYAHMPLICNMDASKMSKRDKAKVARKTLKDAMAKDKSITAPTVGAAIGVATKELEDFIAAENDSLDTAQKLGAHFKIALPEIEVCDFRENGYLASAINNFLALLGWNPGMKLPDGKDLEKFDTKFLAEHFAIDRIGKTSAKFDRVKLLSFNGDAINAMSDEEFARVWREFCARTEPALVARVPDGQRWLWLAKAIKPRAKTLRDGSKPAALFMMDDDAIVFDGAAVEKNLRAEGGRGLELLRAVRDSLNALATFEPQPIHAALEALAKERGMVNDKGAVNVGPIAAPVRVAVSGTGVTPPLGETLAALGRASTLARIARCLEQCGG